jgi:hypothetical protein
MCTTVRYGLNGKACPWVAALRIGLVEQGMGLEFAPPNMESKALLFNQ